MVSKTTGRPKEPGYEIETDWNLIKMEVHEQFVNWGIQRRLFTKSVLEYFGYLKNQSANFTIFNATSTIIVLIGLFLPRPRGQSLAI
jgi:hypothetical protein